MSKQSFVQGIGPAAAAALAAAILLILLVMSVVNAGYAKTLIDGYHALRQTMAANEGLLRLQLDEETGLRGYIATANKALLAPYYGAERDFDPAWRRLRARLATLGDPRLVAAADRLKAINADWQAHVARPALAAPAIAAPRVVESKPLVDAFRAATGSLNDELNERADVLFDSSLLELSRVGSIALALIVLVSVVTVLFATYQNRLRLRTEREERQRQVAAEAFERLQTLVQAMPQMVWIADASGKQTYFNDQWYEYTGKRPDEVIGQRPNVVHPDDIVRTLEAWSAAVKAGTPYETEYRLRAADGSYRWFVARGVPERGADGSILRWIGTCTDIDEQRRITDELRIFADTIPQMAFVADADGTALYRNARWAEYTGSDAIDEAAFARAIHPEDAAARAKAWKAATETGVPYDAQYRLRHHDGTYRWFVGRAQAFREPGGRIARWFGTMTDVHEQRVERDALARAVDAFHRAQLPQSLPRSRYIEFDATYLPAKDSEQFGGDWYDVFTFDNQRYFFSIGDVTGHGLQAAVITGRVRQALFALASVERDPGVILQHANRIVAMQCDTMVTALCGFIDAHTGEFTYASAGHPPALIAGARGAIREMTGAAPPLGLDESMTVTATRDRLALGEMLVCYTDGIIEHGRDVIAGEARLREIVSEATTLRSGDPAPFIRDRMLGAGERSHDDVAILTVRRVSVAQRTQGSSAA